MKKWLRAMTLLVGVGALAMMSTACLTGVGDACLSDVDCGLSQVCLTDAEGFPGGYCTIEDCDINGCDLFSECFLLDIEGQDRAVCLEFCDFNLECERLDYACFDLDGESVCLPDDGVGGDTVPAGAIGAGCTLDSECNEGLCLTNFRGGYCSADCGSDNDCPNNSHCEDFGCLQDCSDNDQCRTGYLCSESFAGDGLSQASCVPDDGRVTKNPNGDDDGESCNSDLQCKGGTCLRSAEGFPGGYCTTLACNNDAGCNGGVCVVDGTADGVCRSECGDDGDCRDGYRCGTAGQNRVCLPEVNSGGGADVTVFDVQCQSGDELRFSLPSGTSGFYIAPFNTSNDELVPIRLNGPNGFNLDLVREFDFYTLNPQLLVNITPLQFPGSDQAQFGGDISDWGGDYVLDVQTSARETCFYIIPTSSPGTRLDVNFYLVGVDGVTANNAESDRDMRTLIDSVSRIYGNMGISIDKVRFLELSSGDTSRFSVIRDFNDIFELVTRSRDPGSSADELLSVNVFLIKDFQVSQAPGLLGVSLGLPGAQGIHGSNGTGLVFTSVNLRQSPADLGQTMAHEIGHFLGLRHTTEHGGDSHDPISDTPRCSNPERGPSCADAENFMFPFSLGGVNQTQTTEGQSFVLRRTGLVK